VFCNGSKKGEAVAAFEKKKEKEGRDRTIHPEKWGWSVVKPGRQGERKLISVN